MATDEALTEGKPTVYFAHGKESGPWGTKITALSQTARSQGWQVVSFDFRSTMDADQRVKMFLELYRDVAAPVVLVGSSMGGYVTTVASRTIRPAGLFLMAPAFSLPGYEHQQPVPCADKVLIIHGWRDQIVPVDNVIDFARSHGAELVVIDDDHPLLGRIDRIQWFFASFLSAIEA